MKTKSLGTFAIFILALLMLGEAVAPAFAEQSVIIPCRFTAVALSSTSTGNVWWSADNTILHVRGVTAKWGLFTGPVVMIGTAENSVDFDFNTKTGEGNAISTWYMTFFAPINYYTSLPTGNPNPYGLGTLDGKETKKVTSIFGVVAGTGFMAPGDAIGSLIATHGTGDFEKAKLSADTISKPTLEGDTWGEYVFIGWNGIPPPVATGVLTFHS